MGTPSSILITIITHNGAETIEKTLGSALSEVRKTGASVLIIDNGSEDDTALIGKRYCKNNGEVVELNTNIGVAAAYNMALARAVELSFNWLLLLDQDTILSPNSVGRLVETGRRLMSLGHRVGAVCPTARNAFFPQMVHPPLRWSGHGLEPVPSTAHLSDCAEPIAVHSSVTSGTLYCVAALASIGGFLEKYFIDFVDHECHLRLTESGWGIWWEPRAFIYHRLGSRQALTRQGLWIEHEPYRYYYMARNMAHGYWRFGGIPGLWHFFKEVALHTRKLWVHGKSPLKCTRFILLGIVHALVGKFGKLASKN